MASPADEYPYRVIPTISNCQGLYSAVKFFWLPSKHTHTHTHTHTLVFPQTSILYRCFSI